MNTNDKTAGRNESETHFTLLSPEMIALIGRRKWYLILPVLFCLALGAVYLLQATPLHHVQARLLVQRQGLPLAQDIPTKDAEAFLATQAEIIRSPAIVRQAVESLAFDPYDAPEVDPTVEILDSLRALPVRGTNVLSIDFYGPQPDQATMIVEAIIESYRQYLYGIDHDAHLESLRVLTRSERDLRADLSDLERKYRHLRKESPLMGQGKDAVMVQRALLTQLGQKLTDARNRRIDLENRMHALGNVPPPIVAQAAPPRPALYTASYSTSWKRETPTFGAREDADTLLHEGGSLPAFDGESLGDMDFERWCAVAENGGIELGDLRPIRQGLVLAKAKRDALAERFGPKHPDFRAAERHVGAWKSRLQEAIGRTPQIIRQELQTAEQYERRLADIYKQEFAEAKTVDGYLLEEQQLLDSIGRVQTIHDSILTQVQQWQLADRALAEGRAGVKVRELETPALAEQVLFPPPWLLAFLCVVVGLIGGSTAITVIEHKQTRTQ